MKFVCRLCGCIWDDEDNTPYRKCEWCGYKEEREDNENITQISE